MRGIPWLSLVLFLGLVAETSAVDVDYIRIVGADESHPGSDPGEGPPFVLAGGGCLAIVGTTGGGLPSRIVQPMVCEGWSRGPNGVAEWGRGDDLVAVGDLPVTWAVSDTAWDAHSGTHALTDSPDGLYGGSSITAATLATPLDLTDAEGASLRFFHRWDLRFSIPSDSASVEVRAGGGPWRVKQTFRRTGGAIGSYHFADVDLTDEVGEPIELRFVVRTSPAYGADGWILDDVLVLTEREVLLDEDFESGTDGWILDGDWGLTGEITEIHSVDRDQNPLLYPVSRDIHGNPCATIDPGSGVLEPIPVPVPTPIRAGEGYVWVTATYQGMTDGKLVRVGPPTFLPE